MAIFRAKNTLSREEHGQIVSSFDTIVWSWTTINAPLNSRFSLLRAFSKPLRSFSIFQEYILISNSFEILTGFFIFLSLQTKLRKYNLAKEKSEPGLQPLPSLSQTLAAISTISALEECWHFLPFFRKGKKHPEHPVWFILFC